MFEIYQDAAGGFRWRLKAGNGEIIADSAESYTRKHDAQRAAQRVSELATFAKVVEV